MGLRIGGIIDICNFLISSKGISCFIFGCSPLSWEFSHINPVSSFRISYFIILLETYCGQIGSIRAIMILILSNVLLDKHDTLALLLPFKNSCIGWCCPFKTLCCLKENIELFIKKRCDNNGQILFVLKAFSFLSLTTLKVNIESTLPLLIVLQIN